MEHEDCFIGSHGKKTKRGDFLFVQILALRQIFFAVERTPFEFAISVNVYEEIQRKNDFRLTQWFYDLWDYWQTVIWDQNGKAFTGQGKISALRLQQDDSIKNALSKPDFKIFTDAIELECDAILTCDKYRSRQDWIYKNYGIMVLFPSDLCELTKDFHSLWY
ncbi:MAG TPA: hypothetical protein VD993_15335 [Chitinophagaceae bacterium]|nr:hypothetical protein [Chitinophagaceae bacterium]